MPPNAITAPVPPRTSLRPEDTMPPGTLDAPSAFAAIALAAVSWDGVLSMAGSRALRHSLDYRHPFCEVNILNNLAITLELPEEETQKVLSVMDVLHADVVSS